MKLLKHQSYQSYQTIIKKILFSISVILLYFLGRKILLPGVLPNFSNASFSNTEELVFAFSGMDLANVSIFSLGLSSYMTTVIVWRLISMNKRWGLQNWSLEKSDRMQKIIMLLFCILQAIGITQSVNSHQLAEQMMLPIWYLQIILGMIIVAGAFLLLWLANLNAEYGVGGMTIIVMSTIVMSLQKNLSSFIINYWNEPYVFILFLSTAVAIVVLIFCQLLVEKAEVRLPLNRLLSRELFYDKSYLPIKFAPASGMPLMYSSSVLILVNVILQWVKNYTQWKIDNIFDFTRPFNLIIYLIIIYLLSLLFAYINLEPEETAKRLQRQGEYFDYVQPGKMTLKYLNYYVNRQAHLGAIYLVILVGLPYVVNYVLPLPAFLLTLPVTVVILTGMLIAFVDEFKVLRIGMWYDNDFRKESIY